VRAGSSRTQQAAVLLSSSIAWFAATNTKSLAAAEWTNKPVYIELLKERGVPVVDADDLADDDWQR
jgi:hypothetical protein